MTDANEAPPKSSRRMLGKSCHRSVMSIFTDTDKSITQKIEQDYIFSTDGCILLTAPHSAHLKKTKGELTTQRNHKIECYVSSIVTAIAREINFLLQKKSVGFLMWQACNIKRVKKTDLDPNYLHDSELEHSPFHQGIH